MRPHHCSQKNVGARIAEDLGIRYVLEGSIQRDGDRIRVSAQLIDAIGGQHVWADRFDRDLTDLFAVKDDITLNIVSNISAEILQGEKGRILPIRLSPTPTICSVSPWTAGKGRRRRIEEAIRLILDCSENRTGV